MCGQKGNEANTCIQNAKAFHIVSEQNSGVSLKRGCFFTRTLSRMRSMNFELCTRVLYDCPPIDCRRRAGTPNILSLAATVTTRRGIASFHGLCPFRPRKLCQVSSVLCASNTVLKISPITRLHLLLIWGGAWHMPEDV